MDYHPLSNIIKFEKKKRRKKKELVGTAIRGYIN
jgi:hypothetical protein